MYKEVETTLGAHPEYSPVALACQVSTKTPSKGVQLVSRIVMRSSRGTPACPSVMFWRNRSSSR